MSPALVPGQEHEYRRAEMRDPARERQRQADIRIAHRVDAPIPAWKKSRV